MNELLFGLLYISLLIIIIYALDHSLVHTNLSSFHSSRSYHPGHHLFVKYPGATHLVPNVSIHAAVIISDYSPNHHHIVALEFNNTFHAASNESHAASALISARVRNIVKLMNQLPFPISGWPAIFTGPCPTRHGSHKMERGLMLAHYRIIRDFTYFDPVLLLLSRTKDHKTGNSIKSAVSSSSNHTSTTDMISSDAAYVLHRNGSLFKNSIPFLDTDVLVVFEDDAESAIENLNVTIVQELSSMSTDILYLGWCEGRLARPVPLCTHAYALTRKGARKLLKHLEPCGLALDEQLVIIIKNHHLTYRRVSADSYSKLNKKYRNMYGEKTYGMFHQNKAKLGSTMGHS